MGRTRTRNRPASIFARLLGLVVILCHSGMGQSNPAATNQPEVNDVHFHLTNYVQQGTDIHDLLAIMGNKVGRIALFGIPLQQEWSYRVDGDRAPKYYLNTDAPLYYYSFTAMDRNGL